MLSVVPVTSVPYSSESTSVSAAPRLSLSSADLKQVESKVKELDARIRSTESEKDNPTVSPHYYRWRGELLALEAVLDLARGKPRELISL